MKKYLLFLFLVNGIFAFAQTTPITHVPNKSKDTVPQVTMSNQMSLPVGTIRQPHVISIPAEAFQASNENGQNGYYKIRRDGLGTLAGSTGEINNTLVAPLMLPDSAVITKIEFHCLSLYPHGYRPHLRLGSRGIVNDARQQGGFGVNTRVTTYSVSSMAMTTASGLADIKTIVNDKMNYRIDNKNNSYYLEVLANKSDQPPVDARTSQWPNDNYLFIWGVEVYYVIR